MIYTLVIKTKDETEPYRTKAGDILTVGDADHTGGYSSRKVNLMVKVDFGDIEHGDVKKLTIPLYNDNRLWHPSIDYENGEADVGVMLTKRRWNIPLPELNILAKKKGITINWNNVSNQPLEKVIFNLSDLILDKITSTKLTVSKLTEIRNIGK